MSEHAGRRAKYWAVHFAEVHRQPNHVRPEWLPPFAIRMFDLRRGGLRPDDARFGPDDTVVTLHGERIPQAVLEATKRLEVGTVRFFDEAGEAVELF